jgi:hypothetical protein
MQALRAKFDGKGKPWGRKEFDQLLGHCQVRYHIILLPFSQLIYMATRLLPTFLPFALQMNSFKLTRKRKSSSLLAMWTRGRSEFLICERGSTEEVPEPG